MVYAKAKRVRLSPRKARLIVDQVRGMHVGPAIELLSFSPHKGGRIVRKVVESAMANAENNEGADIDELRIKEAFVDEGTTFKRLRARARGRADRYFHRFCHITVGVDTD